ncbi:hypothetical protein PDESU_04810 [Pontiella desulfatans]|uniref:HYDIN/VesB/CFA65-like Ig-like domain-containing protein n=1 Tax=Pontiella desulfatans TaxID=2750659 RepID=A0A6C2U8L6_PONDE|nr:choice-of-anchor D domain-containing protein [Pontiella desulfatans]VGO16219.1 hypothetical protein PDESU_04810 [Pontiella desulfatans]
MILPHKLKTLLWSGICLCFCIQPAAVDAAAPIASNSRVLFLGKEATTHKDALEALYTADPSVNTLNLTFDSFDVDYVMDALFTDRTYPKFINDYLDAPKHADYVNALTDKLDENFDYIIYLGEPAYLQDKPELTMATLLFLQAYCRTEGLSSQILLPMLWNATSAASQTTTFREYTYRIADALGIEAVPAGLAWHDIINDGGLTVAESSLTATPSAEAQYTLATTLYSHLFEQNANGSTYSPTGIDGAAQSAIRSHTHTAWSDALTATHYTGDYTSPYMTMWATPMNKSRKVMTNGTSTERRNYIMLDKLFTAAGYPDSAVRWDGSSAPYNGHFPSNYSDPDVQAGVAANDFVFTVGRRLSSAYWYEVWMTEVLLHDPDADLIHYISDYQVKAETEEPFAHGRKARSHTIENFDASTGHPNVQAIPNYIGFSWLGLRRPDINMHQDYTHLSAVGSAINTAIPYTLATGENPALLPDPPVAALDDEMYGSVLSFDERYTLNAAYELAYMLSGLRSLDTPIAPQAFDQTVRFENDGEPQPFFPHAFGAFNKTLTMNLVTSPSVGSISFDGRLMTYTPQPGDVGEVTFTYNVTDGTDTSGNATVTLNPDLLGQAAYNPIAKIGDNVIWNGFRWTGGRTLVVDSNNQLDFQDHPLPGDPNYSETLRAHRFYLDLRNNGGIFQVSSKAPVDGETDLFSPFGWNDEPDVSSFSMGDADWGQGGSGLANPINGFTPNDGVGLEEINWILIPQESYSWEPWELFAGNSRAMAIGMIWNDDGDGLLEDSGDDAYIVKYALSAHHYEGYRKAFPYIDTTAELNAAVGNVAVPEILVYANETEILDGSTVTSGSDHTLFGTAKVEGETVVHTFTVENTGGAPLTLSDVSISGDHADDFVITEYPSGTIRNKTQTSLQITFNPCAAGERNATVTLQNDDPDEGMFSFAIQGVGATAAASTYIKKIEYVVLESQASGTRTPLWNGSSWGPGLAVGNNGNIKFNFWSAASGGTRYRRFYIDMRTAGTFYAAEVYLSTASETVTYSPQSWQNVTGSVNQNMGSGDWNTGGTGTASPVNGFTADDGVGAEEINWMIFSNDTSPGNAAAIAIGLVWVDDGDGLLEDSGNDTILIKYALSANHPSGQAAAFAEMDTLAELNAAVGNVVASPEPEILVRGNSLELTSGDSEPRTADHTDFGTAESLSGTVARTFSIKNFGTADLTISAVNLTGAHSNDFIVTAHPAGTLAADNETTFTVTFDPSADGLRTATVSIASTDGEETPFIFTVQGTGVTTFPDTDDDGIDDDWEMTYFNSLTNATATSDRDEDGNSDYTEFRAGTNPTNAMSFFGLNVTGMDIPLNVMDISWPSATGRTYVVETVSDLEGSWDVLRTTIVATPPTNIFGVTMTNAPAAFYRIIIE